MVGLDLYDLESVHIRAKHDLGIHIKTVSGATGKVNGVVYKNIKLSNIGKVCTCIAFTT